MNFRRLRSGLGLVAFIVVASAGAGLAQVSPNAPPPPPLPNSTLPPSSVLTTPQPATAPLAPTSTFAPVATAAPTVPAGPTASPSPGPKRGHKAAPKGTPEPEASETPEPPQFSSLSGIWELEIQPLGHRLATYEHFSLTQSGNQLVGYWEHDPHKTRNAVSGTFDGHVFQINTQTPDGTAVSFAGYVENMADMVGVRHIGPKDSGTAFTGQHRKKEGAKV